MGDKLSGSDAIARSACEYGLINPTAVLDIQGLRGNGACQCLSATKKVLTKYFEEKSGRSNLPLIDTEEIWAQIEKDANSFMLTNGRSNLSNCIKHAPALFDLLLQQIRRYP
jgi:hypothetical protein